MFVAIEGINGTGKSTIIGLLERHLGYHCYTPATWLGAATPTMDKLEDVDARQMLFMSAMLHASCRIRDFVRGGRKVVVSGYYKRTEIYHRVMGASLSFNSVEELLYLPTVTILLDCREPERRRRVQLRGRRRELWDDIADERMEQIRSAYARQGWPTVDTTDLSAPAAFEEVRRLIMQAKEQVLQ